MVFTYMYANDIFRKMSGPSPPRKGKQVDSFSFKLSWVQVRKLFFSYFELCFMIFAQYVSFFGKYFVQKSKRIILFSLMNIN